MKPIRFWIVLLACQLLLIAAHAKPAPRKGEQQQQQQQQQQRAKPAATQKPKSEAGTRPTTEPVRQCLNECWLVARPTRTGGPS